MLVKINDTFITLKNVIKITTVHKANSNLRFCIIYETADTFEVLWPLNKYVETEEVLFSKMQLLRNQIAQLVNDNKPVLELGFSFNLKKTQITTKRTLPDMPKKMAAKKA